MIVSPSILAADFNALDQEMKKVNDSSCEWVHLDVMDGKFVPNTTFDEKLVKELRPISNKVFDVHRIAVDALHQFSRRLLGDDRDR